MINSTVGKCAKIKEQFFLRWIIHISILNTMIALVTCNQCKPAGTNIETVIAHKFYVLHILPGYLRSDGIKITCSWQSIQSAGQWFDETSLVITLSFYDAKVLIKITCNEMRVSPVAIVTNVSSKTPFIEF